MRTLHIKKGEYIYLANKSSRSNCYKILLVNYDNHEDVVEIGLFDCRDISNTKMINLLLKLGQRQAIFNEIATINALKAEFHGVTFAVGAPKNYRIENDYLQTRPLRDMERRSRGRVVRGRLRFARQPAGMRGKSLCSRRGI